MTYDISKLKEFDIEKSKLGHEVVLVDGGKVFKAEILKYDFFSKVAGSNPEIVACISLGIGMRQLLIIFDREGDASGHAYKLYMAPRIVTRWKAINVNKKDYGYIDDTLYLTLDHAKQENPNCTIAKVEWEE